MKSKIIQVRELAAKGLTQSAIAAELGVKRQRIHQIISTLKEVDKDFKVLRTCRCGKVFEVNSTTRRWCSRECGLAGYHQVPCDCGRMKSRSSKRCRECRKQAVRALEKRCAELYMSGKTGQEISVIVGREFRHCITLARRGGAKIRPTGPRPKDF